MHRALDGYSKVAKAVASTFAFTTAVLGFASSAWSAPQAHILRIDPLAGITNGAPELTTIVELVEQKQMSDVLMPCNTFSGDAALECQSTQLEKPGALWSALKFPDANAQLTVQVDGAASPAKFVSETQWGTAKKKDPRMGTAWLIALDASSGMGTRYQEAYRIAYEFLQAMEPNDQVDLMIFDDRATIADSKWKTYAQRNDLVALLNSHQTTAPSHGRDRALFTQIKTMVNDSFGSLGNTGGPSTIPLHQAMVVLSDGSGRGDAESASPSADVFRQFLDAGRFPADNTSLPKTPLPVISLWFPGGSGVTNELLRTNDQQFMVSLANPEIGGFYDVIHTGAIPQAEQKGRAVIAAVRKRFDEMYVVKWRLSCLNLSVTQTFNLFFTNTQPAILPDGSFKDVPIGVDPSQWPLDIDVTATQAAANQSPLYPGGSFKVFGDFCWDGDKSRAEAYFVPAGTKPDPNANSADLATARKVMQTLIQQGMHGTATDASETSVTFTVPDDDKVLEGTGENQTAHLVVYDNKAKRSSGHDEKSVLTLKAGKKPINWLLLAGIFGGVVVIGLLVVTMLRGGGGGRGGKRRGGGAPPPQPVVAGGGLPPNYGGAPPGGGYGGPPGGAGGGYPPAGGYGGQGPR